MGIVPVWGYQMLIAFALAHIMRLNKVIVLVASNISIPPMIPFILYASVQTGAFVLGEPLALSFHDITFETVKVMLIQYIAGSFVFAAIAGAAGWLFSLLLLRVMKKK